MNYTIATTKDLITDQTLIFGRNGQFYTVGLYDSHGNGTTLNILDDKQANSIYLKLASYIINSYYSFSDRLKVLREYESEGN